MSDRTLKLTSPHLTGGDVKLLQRDINALYKAWHVPYAVDVDSDYGMGTRAAARSALYGLGFPVGSGDDGISPDERIAIRHAEPADKELFKKRADWRRRLALRYGGGAVKEALDFARSHLGVTEHPAGSNTGPTIDKWEAACQVHAAPWCGCFANACLEEAGFETQVWLRYCPAIEARAKASVDGWAWVQAPSVRRGDLVLYGAREAQHVGIVESVRQGVDTATIEGNTSTGPGGSQSNGGIVARRHRHTDGSLSGFPIRGYARPPW